MGIKKRWAITDEIAIADALKCKTRSEFAINYSGSWRRLSDKGFKHLDAACSHMTGYTQWSTEKCVAVARTCKTRAEFKAHTGAYCHMSENKLHELCYAHMGPPKVKGRKKSQKTKEKLSLQMHCTHDWKKINLSWGVYNKCRKCKKSVKVEKTQAELIADMIKRKIAR